jgi:hypothetical protein
LSLITLICISFAVAFIVSILQAQLSFSFEQRFVSNPMSDSHQLTTNDGLSTQYQKEDKNIILYQPSYNNSVLDETITIDGYVDSPYGIPNSTISIYESNELKEDCHLSEYLIKDPISTYFRFDLEINNTLISCDEDFIADSELEFFATYGPYSSNLIKIKVFSSIEDLPIPRWQFTPEKFELPNYILAKFLTSNTEEVFRNIYLDHYHLRDKYPDNLESYYPLESLDPSDSNEPIRIQSIEKNKSIFLYFNTTRDPSFVNVFLDKNEPDDENTSQRYFNLYELEQLHQDPWQFSLPALLAGEYDLIVRVFFNDVVGEYLVHDIIALDS